MPLLILLISYFPILALRAWVGVIIYNWFLMPIGAPDITVVQAMGVFILISLISSNKKSKIDTVEEAIEHVIKSALFPLICLLFAWITTFWM